MNESAGLVGRTSARVERAVDTRRCPTKLEDTAAAGFGRDQARTGADQRADGNRRELLGLGHYRNDAVALFADGQGKIAGDRKADLEKSVERKATRPRRKRAVAFESSRDQWHRHRGFKRTVGGAAAAAEGLTMSAAPASTVASAGARRARVQATLAHTVAQALRVAAAQRAGIGAADA